MNEPDPDRDQPDPDVHDATDDDFTAVDPVESHDEPVKAATRPPRAATRNPVFVVLAAIVVGALVTCGIAFAMGAFDDSGSVGGSDIGEGERLVQNAFTQSVAGDCLDWPAGNPGKPAAVDCAQKHRFEVAGGIDTSLIPGVEFGEDALWPGPERFAAIRDEQCPVMVDQYLNGRLDPQGRFAVGMMYPSQAQWDKGARQLRCGIQENGPDGQPAQFSGRVADQNQSYVWPEGTCIGIDPETRNPTGFAVNCAEPHAFQTTGIVDLAVRFGDRMSNKPWPATGAQNNYLGSICPKQAERFAGGAPALDATTLNVQWSVLSEPSWLAGSRKVVCYLGLPDKRGGFATLVGDAKGGALLINGKAPVPPPAAPPGRALPTPVPLPPGIAPNPDEAPAPAG
ncbi:septum formation family protein [Gordonia westfalica]|uniref:Septum formation n=1 Tax=Gordonia westfalica TaxID=158898 RepID=A0A1H2KSZ7_9ACTN|nr:septum formation family protein [Gordonia westfalica]SDU71476.1 Septum formation [Gordonia westfalica]